MWCPMDSIKKGRLSQVVLQQTATAQPRTLSATMKHCFTFLFFLCCGIALNAEDAHLYTSSYSGEYGGTGGTRFSNSGNQLEGPITAIRIWLNRSYIVGLQVRYGWSWSNQVGGTSGDLEEVFLFPDESIIQVSGKYKYMVKKLDITTNKGRVFPFGKDDGTSFNAAPLFPNTVLRYISGRYSYGINAIGFHWDTYPEDCPYCKSEGTEEEDDLAPRM